MDDPDKQWGIGGGDPFGSARPYKMCLLGEAAVGKSSIALRFARDMFVDVLESTIGAAFLAKTVRLEETGREVRFEVWDTAGQERYHSLAPMYYRGAACAMVVYDVTSRKSWERACAWVAELRAAAHRCAVIALAGNKADLAASDPARRAVPQEEAEAYAAEHGLIFLETSAKTSANVAELFTAVAGALPDPDGGGPGGAGGDGATPPRSGSAASAGDRRYPTVNDAAGVDARTIRLGEGGADGDAARRKKGCAC